MRYAYDSTWRETHAPELQKQGLTRTGSLPVLQWQGHNLRQHLPILRYLARELGKYDGETSFEKYEIDTVADLYNDWGVCLYLGLYHDYMMILLADAYIV